MIISLIVHHALKDMAAWGKPRKRDSYSHLQMNYFTVIRKLIYACPDTNAFIIIGKFFSSQTWHLCHGTFGTTVNLYFHPYPHKPSPQVQQSFTINNLPLTINSLFIHLKIVKLNKCFLVVFLRLPGADINPRQDLFEINQQKEIPLITIAGGVEMLAH